MNISIFGLGYVGVVTAGCLTERGHHIIGVDVHEKKVATLAEGRSPIVEPGLDALLAAAHAEGRLTATTDADTAVRGSTLSIVCVGTPSHENGRLNLSYVRAVISQIGQALRRKAQPHVLIMRSTMLPGSTRDMVENVLLPTDLPPIPGLTILYCPEFLREGTALADFRNPGLGVVGTHDGQPSPDLEIESLFGPGAERMRWEEAELVKYACNFFHATKVAFANEIGRVGKHCGLDSARVMDVLCQDTRLNISPRYLKPGNPFGGSCLPKDVSALAALGRQEGLALPLIESLLPTNAAHLDSLIKLVLSTQAQRVTILGLAFKNDTDDLRGSPMVSLAETLLGRGATLRVYDPHLNTAELIGSNERLISRTMPHLSRLMATTLAEAVEGAEVIVISQKCALLPELAACLTADQTIIDVNDWRELQSLPSRYLGFCW
jgi:GDP-mannose 6-dehydrogenase